MKQVAFLIDVTWLQDEETTIAVRFACLQLITTWPSENCKFGYMLFNSESSRAQTVDAVSFLEPSSTAVEDFETRLSENFVSTRKDDSVSQLETIRWALSRSVTDFAWHSVAVTSPVKASRKRRQHNVQSSNELENRNMLFLFSRLPMSSLTKLRDELLTPSLNKCFTENRIELFWVHDSMQSSLASSNKCVFLRIRDLVQLCGVFSSEQLQYSASLAPRSKIVAFLLRHSTRQPLTSCEILLNNLYNPIEMSIFAVRNGSTVPFENGELQLEGLIPEPRIDSILDNSLEMFIAASKDPHFHRFLIELQTMKSVCVLKRDEDLFVLKPMADSVAAFVRVKSTEFEKFIKSDSSSKSFDSKYFDKKWKAQPTVENVSFPSETLSRLRAAYTRLEPREEATIEEKQEEENFSQKLSTGNFNSEEALLLQMRLTHERAVENKLSVTVAAQSIVSAAVHFFENDIVQIRKFLSENFSVPKVSDRSNNQRANEYQIYILILFESVASNIFETDSVKTDAISATRKLLFLSSPSSLFDFVRETLKELYVKTVRPLLEEIAEEFDLPLFPDSDDETETSLNSFAEPLSGISSLESGPNSLPNSVPTRPKPPTGDPLRRISSANLSQRQIQVIPKRRNVIKQPSPEENVSPKKRASRSAMPTTPRGKRILKTQVVPETPVAKQAPGRVRRTQETLRRQSSVLQNDQVMEVEESPIKKTPKKTTPRKTPKKTPRKTPKKTPRSSPRKQLTRKLMFSPQKKSFTSPTAISLLHLTTSPVLFKPGRKKPT